MARRSNARALQVFSCSMPAGTSASARPAMRSAAATCAPLPCGSRLHAISNACANGSSVNSSMLNEPTGWGALCSIHSMRRGQCSGEAVEARVQAEHHRRALQGSGAASMAPSSSTDEATGTALASCQLAASVPANQRTTSTSRRSSTDGAEPLRLQSCWPTRLNGVQRASCHAGASPMSDAHAAKVDCATERTSRRARRDLALKSLGALSRIRSSAPRLPKSCGNAGATVTFS
mmetsp:Transcript_27392/g.59829  ORF Transcript_27392/g.59829 Transcript_27392/m.59829 type:complete len:234 (+) Transcript_27392:1168-1869(+)